MNTAIFLAIKANEIIDWSQMSTKEAYLYIKAHKLANIINFIKYWSNGQSKQPLINILDDHYPPLEWNHELVDGYPELTLYYEYAKTIFTK